ncbi:MAG: peptidylprolyl isomerase [candidate division Zixibacteria bacterium]|nr:peptidylprolyl isomerase [candidate division Zixibacteria bacterium]MBU1469397.1 peptidylprolyl isomerase [candidate division Zixibacteria bacterium]MBU2624151.1 peptidylprolyl isomerase [candidate division Zixibacteria bacterium]
MLQNFRKFSKAFLYIVIAAFVGTIIFAWGADITRSKGEKGIIGEINGEDIDYKAYGQIVDNYYQQASQSSQREISQSEMIDIRNRAWSDMVTDLIYQQKFNELKLNITNVELAEHLKRFPPQFLQRHPEFQSEAGGFDYQKYLSTMQDPRYVQFWIEVENVARNDIMSVKLQELAVTAARVTGEDLKEEFIDTKELMKFEYALVMKDNMRDPEIVNDTAEVLEYYKNHLDRYFKPAEAKLRYVEFKKDPTASDSLGIKQQIESIAQEIRDSVDFAELAMNLSEDGSAQQGGDLGWFGTGKMVKEFEDAAFALADSGDVSEPVETQFGWHLIMKTGEREQDGNKEIRASHILIKFKPSGQTVSDMQNLAQSFIEEANSSGFEQTANDLGYEVLNTGPFPKGNNAGAMGQVPKANEFAFSNDAGAISHAIEDATGIVVAQVETYRPEGVRGIDESFGRASSDLTQKKLMARAFAKASGIYDLVMEGTSLEEASEQLVAEYDVTEMISRKGTIRKLGRDPNFLGAAFKLSSDNPISGPIMTGKGAAVVKFLDRQAANLQDFASEQDTIKQRMIGTIRQQDYQQWFGKLQDASNVKDYRDQLYGSY